MFYCNYDMSFWFESPDHLITDFPLRFVLMNENGMVRFAHSFRGIIEADV
jgi:hypothetical protein